MTEPPIPDIGREAHDVASRPHRGHRPTGTVRRSTRSNRSTVLAAVVIGLALVGGALVARAVGTRSTADSPGVEDVADPPARADAPAPTADDDDDRFGVDDRAADGATPADIPPSDEHLATESVAELFASLEDDERSWAVVYPSPMGLQALSIDGVTQPDLEVAVGFEESSRFPLLSDGDTSWAIDPNNLDTAYLVSTQFVVIDIDLDGRVGFINDSLDPPNIGESSYGAWGPGFDVPVGAEILAVPRRGLFVLPATGGTYRYQSNGVVPFSTDRLVAASTAAEIYQRCDGALTCELYLVDAAGDETVLTSMASSITHDLDTRYWPSPDGSWLIATDPDGGSVIAGGPNRVEVPIGSTVQAADWANDGMLAALLTRDALLMVHPDLERMLSATLPIEASAPVVLLVGS